MQELKIIQQAVALNEAIEDFCPPALLLVAMCELDLSVSDGSLLYWEFLESDNGSVDWSTFPSPVVYQLAADPANRKNER